MRVLCSFQSDVNLVQETYTDCVWLRESIPRLGEIRGRIVMLQDFTDSEGCGIPWSVVHTSGIGTRVGALWVCVPGTSSQSVVCFT